jgi:cytochrome P450
VSSHLSIPASSSERESPQVVRRGAYVYPPGLRFNLPFYRFHSFFDPTNPILLFEYLQRYGRAAHYRILATDVVLLNDPADIAEVLIDKAAFFGKDRTQKRMKILLGEGMITSDGETHNRGRRIAAPAFHRRRIERYAAQIVEIADTFRTQWHPGAELNIAAEMMRLTLQITARTLFDTEVTPEIHEINDQVNVVMDLYNFLVGFPRAELFLNSTAAADAAVSRGKKAAG